MLRRVLTASAVSFALAWSSSARAVPNVLTEQGRLLDASNNPITATQTMVFAVYSSPTAGTPATALWTETQTITPDNGFFSAELGTVTALPASIFNGQPLYLGLTVGSDSEMTPRQPMLSVPYALTAQNVIGDITPTSVTVGTTQVINSAGKWVGPSSGLVGPTGPGGPPGATGAAGTPGAVGPTGAAGAPGGVGPTGAAGAVGKNGTNGTNGTTGAAGPAGPTGPTGPMPTLPYNAANGIAQADSTGRTPAASVRNGLIAVATVTATGPITSATGTPADVPGLTKSFTTQKGDLLVCTFSGQLSMTTSTGSGGIAQLYVSDAGGAFSAVTATQIDAILATADIPAQSATGIWTVTAAGTTILKASVFANGAPSVTFNQGNGALTVLQIRP